MEKLSPWHRQVAASIAEAHPLDGKAARASGNHLVAQNDEAEPAVFTEEELLAADMQRSQQKAQRFHTRNDRAARELDAAARDRGVLP